jgi:hypothetical protein
METEYPELMIIIPIVIFIIISITSFIAFKYWGPGGVIEKRQHK